MSSWETQSNRETVETLLAMGFIPTWLEELLEEGDALQENVRFLQKSVDMLGAVRGDWLNKYNDMTVSVGQLQQANKDLAQLVYDRTEKLEAIREIREAHEPDDPYVGEARTLEKIWKVLGE